MSDHVDPDGFVPIDPGQQPAAVRPRGSPVLKGCLIALAVMVALGVAALVGFGYLVSRSVIDDPAAATQVAQAMAEFTLPPGYVVHGAMRIPAVGKIAFLGPAVDENASVSETLGHQIMLGRFDIEMSEKQMLDALDEASGQKTDGSKFKSVRCTLGDRPAACLEGEGTAETGEPSSGAPATSERWRMQAVAVVVGSSDSFVAAVFGDAKQFDPAFAKRFFDSVQIRPR